MVSAVFGHFFSLQPPRPEDIDTLHSFFQPQQRSERSAPRTPSSGRCLTPGSMVGTPRAVFDDKVARTGAAGATGWVGVAFGSQTMYIVQDH